MKVKYHLRALVTALCLAPCMAKAEGGPPAVSLRFTTEGNLLPRRGHEALALESVNIEALDARILHVPEADTLAMLTSVSGDPSQEAQTVWGGQIAVPNAAVNKPASVTLDVLDNVKTLQPGLYIATVTAAHAQATARKLFMISNIGLEVFSATDGITAQARLLSEATVAQNIELALIARNNREIARARTDADGVARFSRDQVSGQGNDASAALYAYGADGEFTALLLPAHPPAVTTPIPWIVTDRHSYKPGEDINGLVLVRDASGKAVSGPLYAQLENPAGGVAEIQPQFEQSAQVRLHLHAPPVSLGTSWIIAVYDGKDGKKLGSASIIVSNSPTPIGKADRLRADAGPAAEANSTIIISPGRRSFQRGETANISVQPPTDADVTVALLDAQVRTIVRQHIGKEGGVVQLPIPGDASGGIYVLATAFTAPAQGGHPLQRSYGLQWIDIDEGGKRMSVRLDTPEKAMAGAKLPVGLILPDAGGNPSSVLLIGTNAGDPVTLDPFAFFYGQKPLAVAVADSYAGVIGAPEPPPEFAGTAAPASSSAPALLWVGPTTADKDGKAAFAQMMPMLSGKATRLRLSAIAWSDDRFGYAETSIAETPGGRMPKSAPKLIPPSRARIQAAMLKPGETLALKPGQGLVASLDPVVAAPVQYYDMKAMKGDWEDQTGFTTGKTPEELAFSQNLLLPLDDDAVLHSALIALQSRTGLIGVPPSSKAKLLDAVQAMLTRPDGDDDQKMLACYILFTAGRINKLEARHWLNGSPHFEGMLADAARLVITKEAPLPDAEIAKLHAAIDADQNADLETKALTLYMLAQAEQPWPERLAHNVSDEALKQTALSTRGELALRLAQGRVNRDAPKLEAFGKPAPLAIANNSAAPVEITSRDKRPLYFWIVSGLAGRE